MNNLLVHQMHLASFPKNKSHLIFADTRPYLVYASEFYYLQLKTHLRPGLSSSLFHHSVLVDLNVSMMMH